MEDRTPLLAADRLHAVLEVQRQINAATLDTDELMRVVTQAAQRLTGADAGVVELAEDGLMVYRAVSGTAAGSIGTTLRIATSLSGMCVRQGEPLRSDDTDSDPRVDRETCRRTGVASMVVVPLIHEGTTLGVLKVTSTRPGSFDDDDLQILELLGGFIATSVRNASNHGEVVERALHDGLTGLPNRQLLTDRLELALHRSGRQGSAVCVFFVDLDGFKGVNDRFGHSVGDQLLKAIAGELSGSLRGSDTVARLGGDEFVIVYEGVGDSAEQLIRSRIDRAVERVSAVDPAYSGIRASVGYAATTSARRSAVELLAAADAAMYHAKRGGRSGDE